MLRVFVLSSDVPFCVYRSELQIKCVLDCLLHETARLESILLRLINFGFYHREVVHEQSHRFAQHIVATLQVILSSIIKMYRQLSNI